MKTQDSQHGRCPASSEALAARVRELEGEIEQARNEERMLMEARSPSFLDVSERLRRFIESDLIPIFVTDVDGKIYDVNDAVVNLLGYTKEELMSGAIDWYKLTPEEWRALSYDKAQERATGKTVIFEKEYFHKDGHRIPILLSASPLDRGDKFCVTFFIDLTGQKRLERELKASESQFRLLAEAVPQIVWITTSRGRTLYCNQRFYDLTGLKREDDDGFLWLSIVHPDDREKYVEEAQKAAQDTADFDHQTRFRMIDGSYRWQLVRGVPIQDLETGSFLWFGTCTDIDDQRRLSDEVREREAQFRTLADAIPQIVFTAGPSGEMEYFNHRWFEYTGLTEEQSRKDAWHLLIHPDDLPKYLGDWHNALETGDSYELEFRLKRAMGTARTAADKAYRRHLARAVALRGKNGQILKWLATWTDIERQRSKPKSLTT